MFVHFQAVVDDESVFIIQVEVDDWCNHWTNIAKKNAEEIVRTVLGTDDFEIKELTLPRLLSQLTFVNDIAELVPITKP